MEEKKIGIAMILEVLGRPKESLEPALKDMIKELKEEKGVTVNTEKINEPKLVKDSKDIYTNFAELEAEVDDTLLALRILFKYMPSHIEITSPEKIMQTNNELNETLNEITRRLHAYDEVARIFQIEKAKMMQKIKELEEKKD